MGPPPSKKTRTANCSEAGAATTAAASPAADKAITPVAASEAAGFCTTPAAPDAAARAAISVDANAEAARRGRDVSSAAASTGDSHGGVGSPSGGDSSGGGLGGSCSTRWQRSIQRILPTVIATAQNAKQAIIDAKAETSPNGTDPLVCLSPPTRVRRKNRKTAADHKVHHDKRYKEDDVYKVHKCSFFLYLCDSKRRVKTAFNSGEDVCAKVTACNPTDGDILVGIGGNGDPDGKSFFGGSGLRIEIDGLEKVRIARSRRNTALLLKAGKSYTFFRTVMNGDGNGDRAGENA